MSSLNAPDVLRMRHCPAGLPPASRHRHLGSAAARAAPIRSWCEETLTVSLFLFRAANPMPSHSAKCVFAMPVSPAFSRRIDLQTPNATAVGQWAGLGQPESSHWYLRLAAGPPGSRRAPNGNGTLSTADRNCRALLLLLYLAQRRLPVAAPPNPAWHLPAFLLLYTPSLQ